MVTNSTKKMMQRWQTFHWNGVSPETRPTGRCSRRIRPIAIERTRVSLNARQTLPITGQLQGLAMRVHHNERSGFIVTCFGWESTIMADLLGFHIIPHVSWRVTIGYTSKEAMERIRRHARHTVPGILNGEHVVYRETRLHEGDRLTISISIQCHAATCTSKKT